MNCKICNSDAKLIFKTMVLKKYDVAYYQCTNCEFIQTEDPYWLSEAYENAITNLDIGLAGRNVYQSTIASNLISKYFNGEGRFVDYGGGYGMFVRLMRDKGFDYYLQDQYCANLFAKHFGVEDIEEQSFELLTAFEVFEHLENPVVELEKMLKLSENIYFSTELQPSGFLNPDTWWYFIPNTGQHVALYSYKSLELLGKKYGLKYYNNGSLHLFTKKRINPYLFKIVTNPKYQSLFRKIYRRPSLLPLDFEKMKSLYDK